MVLRTGSLDRWTSFGEIVQCSSEEGHCCAEFNCDDEFNDRWLEFNDPELTVDDLRWKLKKEILKFAGFVGGCSLEVVAVPATVAVAV